MTAQELKNSILMQAVQGKLVPQDPNDEPASVLLAKIRAEKEQMMKEGKIKKEPISEIYVDPSDNQHYEKVGKTIKCIEDEIPFKLPNGWAWCRMNSVFQILNGDRGKNYPAKSTLSRKGIPFVSATNLDGKKIIEDERLMCMSEEQYNKISNGKLIKGDVLVCIRGSLGKHGRFLLDKGAIASSLVICRAIYSLEILYSYFMLFLETPIFYKQIKNYDNGTAQPNLAAKSLQLFFIPIPPQSEIHRIVEKYQRFLSKINDYKTLYTKSEHYNQEIKEKLKKSILQYAIQGKLVAQNHNDEPASELIKRIRAEKEKLIKSGKLKKDKNESYIYRGSDNSYYEKFQNGKEICIDDEIPFEIPQSWEWMRVCNCADIYTGNSISESVKKSRYTGLIDGLNYIGTKDVNFDNTINYNNGIKIPLEEPKFKKAYKNNTLICVEGGSAGRKVAILSENVCFGNKLATINSWTINPMYIYLLFQSSIVQEFFKNNMTGIIGGVSVNKLKKLLIPVPPLNEQVRIVSTIKQVFEHL